MCDLDVGPKKEFKKLKTLAFLKFFNPSDFFKIDLVDLNIILTKIASIRMSSGFSLSGAETVTAFPAKDVSKC